jgi:adenylate cyclase
MSDNVEIERRYLLHALPTGPMITAKKQEYMQGYLRIEPYEDRLVQYIKSLRSIRTVKIGHGLRRQEFKQDIPNEMFNALWPYTQGKRLDKRRYTVVDGLTWEVTEFIGLGIVTAEVELPSADHPVELPSWLKPYVVREVTTEQAYESAQLAR